jgi:penicillin amidase
MKIVKWLVVGLLSLVVIVLLGGFVFIKSSLPQLDGTVVSSSLNAPAKISRDRLGTAVIHAETQNDAAYLLGYAHAQDRLFQMDLLRRQSSGELSALVGSVALNTDKKHRFHQFRTRAESRFQQLSKEEQSLLVHYTKGVNEGASSLSSLPFEYHLLSASFEPWQPSDSLLAVYSMYIDLQLAQTEIDFRLNALKTVFGDAMYRFFTLPSTYQAAIDNTNIPLRGVEIPNIDAFLQQAEQNAEDQARVLDTIDSHYDSVLEQPDIGSNNWAVSGALTESASALVSNDMHLGLRVPAIWYRAQLNYSVKQTQTPKQSVKVTGVSLPGTPAVIVGSNGHIAWGFTNSNVDNVDWVEVTNYDTIKEVTEIIHTPDGDESFSFEINEIGPIREFQSKKYALKWVAHQDYAVNLKIADIAKEQNVASALELAKHVRMPAQNMVIGDADGNIAWQLAGAITSRSTLIRHAIKPEQFSTDWNTPEMLPANQVNPESGRVWTANARVVGTGDLEKFGDGGYALGARQHQIMQALMQQDTFTEDDFYRIQLDNRALFLQPWHNLLLSALQNSPQKYAKDIRVLENWQACACDDDIAYTLVRRFRSALINTLLAPINNELKKHELSTSYLLRSIEPAVWTLLQQQPQSWLAPQYRDYTQLILDTYSKTKTRLMKRYDANENDLTPLEWGNVNQLRVNHPFANQLSFMKSWLNMPTTRGFGDSYMPNVQSGSFGASQRLIVRPGKEDEGILTVPGGQSGHFLSDFYFTGFDEYVGQEKTPLLPSATIHTLNFEPE